MPIFKYLSGFLIFGAMLSACSPSRSESSLLKDEPLNARGKFCSDATDCLVYTVTDDFTVQTYYYVSPESHVFRLVGCPDLKTIQEQTGVYLNGQKDGFEIAVSQDDISATDAHLNPNISCKKAGAPLLDVSFDRSRSVYSVTEEAGTFYLEHGLDSGFRYIRLNTDACRDVIEANGLWSGREWPLYVVDAAPADGAVVDFPCKMVIDGESEVQLANDWQLFKICLADASGTVDLANVKPYYVVEKRQNPTLTTAFILKEIQGMDGNPLDLSDDFGCSGIGETSTPLPDDRDRHVMEALGIRQSTLPKYYYDQNIAQLSDSLVQALAVKLDLKAQSLTLLTRLTSDNKRQVLAAMPEAALLDDGSIGYKNVQFLDWNFVEGWEKPQPQSRDVLFGNGDSALAVQLKIRSQRLLDFEGKDVPGAQKIQKRLYMVKSCDRSLHASFSGLFGPVTAIASDTARDNLITLQRELKQSSTQANGGVRILPADCFRPRNECSWDIQKAADLKDFADGVWKGEQCDLKTARNFELRIDKKLVLNSNALNKRILVMDGSPGSRIRESFPQIRELRILGTDANAELEFACSDCLIPESAVGYTCKRNSTSGLALLTFAGLDRVTLQSLSLQSKIAPSPAFRWVGVNQVGGALSLDAVKVSNAESIIPIKSEGPAPALAPSFHYGVCMRGEQGRGELYMKGTSIYASIAGVSSQLARVFISGTATAENASNPVIADNFQKFGSAPDRAEKMLIKTGAGAEAALLGVNSSFHIYNSDLETLSMGISLSSYSAFDQNFTRLKALGLKLNGPLQDEKGNFAGNAPYKQSGCGFSPGLESLSCAIKFTGLATAVSTLTSSQLKGFSYGVFFPYVGSTNSTANRIGFYDIGMEALNTSNLRSVGYAGAMFGNIP